MDAFFVRVNGKYHGISFCEIRYVEAFKNYVRIYTTTQNYVVHHTLKQIEEHLPINQFCRIHKSYIISVKRLTAFDHESVYIDRNQLPLSSQYFEPLKNKVHIVGAKRSGDAV